MKVPIRLLLVEDSEEDAFFLLRRLERDGYGISSERVATLGDLATALEGERWDVVVADFMLPSFNALDALRLVRKKAPDLPFIIVSGIIGEENAVRAMRSGAHDYVPKKSLGRLGPVIEREICEAENRRARKQAEEKYRSIFENAVDGIFQTTVDGKLIAANPAMAQILGYASPKELLASVSDGSEQLHIDLARRAEFTRLVEQRGAVSGFETEMYRKDGGKAWISVQAWPLLDLRGELAGYQGTVEDVTERKEAQEALRKSEERFRSLVQDSSDITSILDRNGEVLYQSPAVERVLGHRPEERIGANLSDLVHPDDRERLLGMLARYADEPGARKAVEYRVQDKGGRWRHMEAIVSNFLHDPDIEGFIINSRDITERKKAEEALREQTRTLEKVNRIGRLLSSELDLEKLVQAVTDEATGLTGARFGAFFYNGVEGRGKTYTLYTISGVPREAFSKFPMPRKTEIFGPTFEGQEVVRIDNVHEDQRYGNNPPYNGMPEGHLPVASYLAVPVISRSGETLGSLFFGHPEVGVFGEREEQIAVGLAAQAAITLDNARLFESMRGSEERFRLLVEGVKDYAIFMLDPEGRVSTWNEGAKRIKGYEAEEIIGENFSIFYTREDVEVGHLEEKLHIAVAEGRYKEEGWRVRKNGSYFWASDVITALRDEKGRLQGFSKVVRDITERRRAEEALRYQSRLTTTITDNAASCLFMLDERGYPTYMNPTAEAVTGFTLDEIKDRPLHESIHHTRPDGTPYPMSECPFGKSLLNPSGSTEPIKDIEEVFVRKDGAFFPISCSITPLKPDGETVGAILEVRDITESKQIEKAFRQSEEIYRTVVEQAMESIFLVDAGTGRIIEANAAFHQSFGYTAEEIEKLTLYDIVASDRESVDWNIRRILDENTLFTERKYRRKDGSLIDVEVSASAIPYEGSVAMCFVTHDVTERKRTEESLRRSLDVLLALREAGQILNSTLESEEIGSRLLEITRGVFGLTAAVISVENEDGQLRVWREAGLRGLWRQARYAPAAETARRRVLTTGQPCLFRLRRPDSETGHLVGLCLPLQVRDQINGILEAYGSEALAEEDAMELLKSLANQAASALENARLYGELAKREKRLEDLIGKIFMAQEEERRRVAYEVHDGPTQLAVAVYQHLQAFARNYASDSAEGREVLKGIVELARRTVGDSRQIIANLRPTALDDFGLAAAIRLQTEALRAEGWQISYEETLGNERVSDQVETALYRVAQEALTNVRKHARASRVRVKLSRSSKGIRLLVRDWGEGFEFVPPATEGGPGERVGLPGMKERIALVGGTLKLHSKKGVGTLIVADIPLSKGKAGDDAANRG